MWTTENRGRYDRSGLRYESDLTDEEWVKIEPLIPPAKGGGNRRTMDVREVSARGCMCSAPVVSGGRSRRTSFSQHDVHRNDAQGAQIMRPGGWYRAAHVRSPSCRLGGHC